MFLLPNGSVQGPHLVVDGSDQRLPGTDFLLQCPHLGEGQLLIRARFFQDGIGQIDLVLELGFALLKGFLFGGSLRPRSLSGRKQEHKQEEPFAGITEAIRGGHVQDREGFERGKLQRFGFVPGFQTKLGLRTIRF